MNLQVAPASASARGEPTVVWGAARTDDILLGLRRAGEAAAGNLQAKWAKEAAAAVDRVPGVQIEGQGECLFLNALSPGCRACKNGTWDCLFVTMACNLNCPFCWSPCAPSTKHFGSACGTERRAIVGSQGLRVSGVSFSGGEPFLDPAALLAWIDQVKTQSPGCYYWVYTNGLAGDEAAFARVAESGVHEARFNLAASGYLDPDAMKRLRFAVNRFAAVTVEIPAIPDDARLLLEALPRWCEAGIRYLNLHELVYEPGSNSWNLPGPRSSGNLGDGHVFAYHPASRALTLAVMEKVAADRLPIGVNDCSLHSKSRQIRGRRLLLAPLMKREWERPAQDSMFETCGIWGKETVRLFHPDHLDALRRTHPRAPFVRLLRLAPLQADETPQWRACDPV